MPGEEARHNLACWVGDEYVGLGYGAFGYVRGEDPTRGVRWRNQVEPK
jgi:coproporphyrinogen III oxidase-like Fe-S oxidoreductase